MVVVVKTGFVGWMKRNSPGEPRGWQRVCYAETESACWYELGEARDRPPYQDAHCCEWMVLSAKKTPAKALRVSKYAYVSAWDKWLAELHR
jgi:hypothetical protein